MGLLDHKVVFISGGTSGIGEDCVYEMAREGAKVVFCGRSEEKGKNVEDKCREEGYDVTFLCADMTKVEDNRMVIEKTIQLHGRIDVLLANSGGGSENLELDVMSNNQWKHDMAIYIHSPFLLSKYAIKQMLKQGASCII